MQKRSVFLTFIMFTCLFGAIFIALSCDDISAPETTGAASEVPAPEWWDVPSESSSAASYLDVDAETGVAADGYWAKAFGVADVNENFIKMVQTSDGGCAVLAQRDSRYNGIWLFKADENGAVLWQKHIAVVTSINFQDMIESSDSGFVIMVRVYNDEFNSYIPLLIKLDAGGNYLWTKTYEINGDGGIIVMAPLDDGSIMAAGYSDDGVPVMKIDQDGNIIWVKKIAGESCEYARAITITEDGNAVIAGVSSYTENRNDIRYGKAAFIVKMSPDGELLWKKAYSYDGDLNYAGLEVKSVEPSSDGGFILGGEIEYTRWPIMLLAPEDRTDQWVLKCDSEGDISWSKRFRNMLSVVVTNIPGGLPYTWTLTWIYTDYITSAIETSDGGCLVQGYSESLRYAEYATLYSFNELKPWIYEKQDHVGWRMKMNSEGDVSWIKGYRDPFRLEERNESDYFEKLTRNSIMLGAARETGSGDLVAAGSVILDYDAGIRDILLFKTDSAGNIAGTGMSVDEELSPTYLGTHLYPDEDDIVPSDTTAEAVTVDITTFTDTDCVVTDM